MITEKEEELPLDCNGLSRDELSAVQNVIDVIKRIKNR
tara:strand:- start:478 stop:591 length:114 start_codon:yes stop_codon:yes gene_type:complete